MNRLFLGVLILASVGCSVQADILPPPPALKNVVHFYCPGWNGVVHEYHTDQELSRVPVVSYKTPAGLRVEVPAAQCVKFYLQEY